MFSKMYYFCALDRLYYLAFIFIHIFLLLFLKSSVKAFYFVTVL